MATLNEIRRTFLGYFERHGHAVVESSPLVPRNDPTLMFTAAGMVQFKNVFTGMERRDYVRAVTSQKCVRAGGKHNDLDNVGYTARHHTFFEMLGNFSFGDYFKETAIPLAWDLVTKEFGLPKDRLLVTVYHDDDEAADLWRRYAGLPDERIIRIATSDNFWTMGPTGPCGPCSEIFFDHGPHVAGGPPGSPDEDGDRFMEIWNLVFMQFEQISESVRENLPRPSIDTGMGLERIGAVLQGKHDNYDTDVIRALILASAEATGTEPDGDGRIHHRVVADHLRASAFLMADGVMPSNEGRGYVLRRIMRRAMRHVHQLGAEDPVMHRLVPSLVAQMGQAFPELSRAEALIGETLRLEETRFRTTLSRGLRLLEEETARLGEREKLPGNAAFRLYDTYGFPLDLTQDALREQGREVDLAGFESAMAEQKQQARAAWSGTGEAADGAIWFDLRDEVGATDFLGYGTEQAEGAIRALVRDGQRCGSAKAGERVALIANQTPFYAESGGQVGDTGTIRTATGHARVEDVRKHAGDVFVHTVTIEDGELVQGEAAVFAVDASRRAMIRANHSATHLLHEALREALGDHVAQRGSLVAAEKLRFDFVHTRPVAPEEIAAVERAVNAYVRQNGAVTTRIMTPEDAQAAGARALFGEKYGDEVRVVSMGTRLTDGDCAYSMELCGGTHVAQTGEIGLFKIVAESASAAGIRRIEALTGDAALQMVNQQMQYLRDAAATVRTAPDGLSTRLTGLLEERQQLEAEAAGLRQKLALAGNGGGATPRLVAGVQLLTQVLEGVSAKELRGLVDAHKEKLGSGAVLLIADTGGKAAVAAGVTSDLTDRLSAVDMVRAAAAALGGAGGGGRPDMAQAGGTDPSKASEAVEAVEQLMAR